MLAQDVMGVWLTEEYDYKRPRRGQIRQGEILKIEESGVAVDLGLKRDGFIPRTDLELLDEDMSSTLEPGQEVTARIVRLEDEDGRLVLSLYQARFEQEWVRAQEMLESGEVLQGAVTDFNRGGLIVAFGHLRAFVPASHLTQRYSSNQLMQKLEECVGQELVLQVIEVNRDRRRLILSERLARQQMRERHMERLLNELVEGQLRRGTVSRLHSFGAFVDLGGADGLIHISELAWRRVRHPNELLQEGDEIDVYILRLDHQRRRIALSLKRIQPDPWELVDQTYTTDQLVLGKVTNVVDFGAFVALDLGVEGLIHVSELADPPSDPREIVKRGDDVVVRILRIDSFRQRIGLSLKRVDAEERDHWLAQRADGRTLDANDSEEVTSVSEESPSGDPERPAAEQLQDASSPVLDGQPEDESLWMSLMEDTEARDR